MGKEKKGEKEARGEGLAEEVKVGVTLRRTHPCALKAEKPWKGKQCVVCDCFHPASLKGPCTVIIQP